MTQKDITLAVIAANSALATNNPKGLTDALRQAGYPVDGRFDIMSHDALAKALLELYTANPRKWAQVMAAVPFNYEKTDSSTTQNTRTLFENIARSFNPDDKSASLKSDKPKWWQTALDYLIGSTTTTHQGAPPPPAQKVPVWAYVSLAVIGVIILAIVWRAFSMKNI